jgi:hypothetical protein
MLTPLTVNVLIQKCNLSDKLPRGYLDTFGRKELYSDYGNHNLHSNKEIIGLGIRIMTSELK